MLDNKKKIMFGWIEACIRYAGEFGPAEKVMYQETFGVSEPSASRHQAAFVAAFEDQVGPAFKRDGKGRLASGRLILCEKASLPDALVFERTPSIYRWLQDNLGGSGYFEIEIRRNEPKPWIIRSVIKSIRSQNTLRITYYSRSAEGERVVSPHSIVRVAGRMHMRAYDHSKNEYRDFVLSRISNADLTDCDPPFVGSETDSEWNSFRTIFIDGREDIFRAGIQQDYGLDGDGRRVMRVREALVNYLIDEINPGYSPTVQISID